MSDNNSNNSNNGQKLPEPGQGWDQSHEPQAPHHIPDNSWGQPLQAPPSGPSTHSPYAGAQGTSNPQQPGYGQPQGPGYGQPQGPGYGQPQGPGGPMMQPPHYNMQASQLSGEEILPIILSLFLPGVGHMMLGQTTKGIVILAATFLSCGMAYIVSLIVAYDAYMVAKARKRRPIGEWEFFPN